MIKAKQRNLRAFEIENHDDGECIEFLKKNAVLLRDYLVIFVNPISPALSGFITDLGLNVFLQNALQNLQTTLTQSSLPTKDAPVQKKALKVLPKLRSGEEVEHDGDLIILENIHNGARVYASGNLSIFGKCEGRIECGGDYLILKSIMGNHIIFSGQIFSEEMLERINANQNKLKLIVRNGDCITIKEIE
ncbi:septum site-determining protein MinC [Helicobacter mustelae]|uniref:Putative septum site-determining protein MinC n=1 Tax=Helicobacter mustelae (strain ATCC 43772 / CCUG 25715 / CIP 103759 / LMG 18044 / NCTC 12198 / R85-136P) TaxID=679897 RepID=D3UG13_HELM1|nr:septum site-determining protein MinC [Helicobacter mustelae]CBG39434.1 Putative septum site-determining protein; MinC [Helicobacter mustelae 12198]SQH70946.1 septum site-determining protein; MinC [Helicobacter mustelae]STP12072.1 septum site-determining protein; MinC [Helicobacter mustelae]